MGQKRYPFNFVTVRWRGYDCYRAVFEYKPPGGATPIQILEIQVNRRQLEAVRRQVRDAVGNPVPFCSVRVPGVRAAIQFATVEARSIGRMLDTALEKIDQRIAGN